MRSSTVESVCLGIVLWEGGAQKFFLQDLVRGLSNYAPHNTIKEIQLGSKTDPELPDKVGVLVRPQSEP